MYISGTINGGMQKFAPLRFAYDLIYFMFFGLLFQNIISGIVIDTFAELRTERNEINADKKNKCYICNDTKENVIILLFRLIELSEKILNLIFKNISYGIMFIMCIVQRTKMKQIIQEQSMRLRIRFKLMI